MDSDVLHSLVVLIQLYEPWNESNPLRYDPMRGSIVMYMRLVSWLYRARRRLMARKRQWEKHIRQRLVECLALGGARSFAEASDFHRLEIKIRGSLPAGSGYPSIVLRR